jgi:hypothetical protein
VSLEARAPTRPTEPAAADLGPVVGAVLVAGAALAAAWLRLGLPIPACAFREWTGIPCPTCGTTRLVASVLSGDLPGAFVRNPLVFCALAAAALFAAVSTTCRLLGLRVPRIELRARERLALRVLAAFALAAGWAWVVWHDS